MRITISIFLLLFPLAPLAATTASRGTDKIKQTILPNGLEVQEYRLKNGLQLLLVPDKSAPVFSFQLWFKVGSVTEKMDPKLQKTGLAHFFEHMMFRGTPKNPDQIFDKKLSAAGAVGLNATTWMDRTNYYQSLPKESLELVFDLESDRMRNLIINQKLFDTERGAVVGELKMRNDKPGSIGWDSLWNLSFEKHPYRYPVIGSLEELQSFTVKEAQYFYKKYYSPNNATLILLGDFEVSKSLALAEKYFGKMPSQKIEFLAPPEEPAQQTARSKIVEHPLANADLLLLGYKVPKRSHSDIPALEAMAGILAYGNSSWMEKDFVQKGIASSASASITTGRYPGLFNFSVQLSPGQKAKEVESKINSYLDNLKAGKFSEEELSRAINQYLLYSYEQLLSLDNIGDMMGEALCSTDDYLNDFSALQKIKSISKNDVVRVANAYFGKNSSNSVTVIPPPKGDK